MSLTSYFALPPDIRERAKQSEEVARFLALFDQFIDLPATEEDRRALWKDVEGAFEDESDDDDINRTDFDSSTISGLSDEGAMSGTRTKPSRPSVKKQSSWFSLPVDITFPNGSNPGEYPPSDFRHQRLKVIPMVTEGPWIVKTTVPSKPVMMGRKIGVRYFRGPNYFELDMHIASSKVAERILAVCRGYTKSYTTDIAFMIQSETSEELPERILAAFCLDKLDVDVRQKLYENTYSTSEPQTLSSPLTSRPSDDEVKAPGGEKRPPSARNVAESLASGTASNTSTSVQSSIVPLPAEKSIVATSLASESAEASPRLSGTAERSSKNYSYTLPSAIGDGNASAMSVFNNYEFPGISPEVRARYCDRAYSHKFKVRGPTYFVDQRKEDPGPAMCKLMLFEIYEVEPRVRSTFSSSYFHAAFLRFS